MQQVCCDLQVDVNGEDVFMVDKKTLVSFSKRFAKLFANLMDNTRNLKVVFHDFPRGAEGFELIARFCYNNGRTEITPANIVLLNCVAQFMEMESAGLRPSLLNQTRKSLDGISFWSWSELLVALKECQDLLSASKSSLILDKVLDCVIGRLASPIVASPYTSSSENSSFKCSCDTRSSYSIGNNFSHWWFEDLLFLSIDLIGKVIKLMICHHFDHATITKFLLCYRRSRFLTATPTEKCRIMEVIINLLPLFDRSSVSCKLLFDMLRVASSLKNISKLCKSILENLIGSQLDQATIDFLLVPSPQKKHHMYDVNLVLRLAIAFCNELRGCLSLNRLRKVASLLDSYLVEVSADSYLKPSKFAALALLLPTSARESHDRLFKAIDIYLQVHGGICEAEKMRICSALNYAKLSTDALRHLARNSRFPSRIAIHSFINQQSKLEILLEGQKDNDTSSSSVSISTEESIKEKENSDQILMYAKRAGVPGKAEQLDVQLQGMQCRVTELEKLSGIMQTRIGNIPRTRLSSLGNNARFLPKLCS